MTETDVERVARALAVADGKDPDAPAWVRGYGPHAETWGVCWRDQYASKAKAAIAVLSHPRDDGPRDIDAPGIVMKGNIFSDLQGQ